MGDKLSPMKWSWCEMKPRLAWWTFPSLDSLREDDGSGFESGVTAAILIIPLSAWSYAATKAFENGAGYSRIVFFAALFLLLSFQVAVWVGLFFRAMGGSLSSPFLAVVLIGFSAYVAAAFWASADSDRLISCIGAFQGIGASFLMLFSWREWDPAALRALAVIVCVAYVMFAFSF